MSCWVLPSVAADLWGVSLDAVLEQIRAGSIASKIDEGSLVVDVGPLAPRPAPAGQPAPQAQAPRRRRARASRFAARTSDSRAAPAAHVPSVLPAPAEPAGVTAAELTALGGAPAALDDDEMGPVGDPDPDRDGTPPDDGPPLHWEQVRARVARTRKPPSRRTLA